jgi:RimJ/RimL family protein N-acetyltransferase
MMRLVPATATLLDAAIVGDEALARAIGCPVTPGWVTFVEALPAARAGVVDDPERARWGTRFFVAGDPSALVGWGGFKGPPDGGTVEIGYEIAASVQGRGLATAAARAMVDEAFADAGVSKVSAHTLAEENASNRVLAKLGFARVAEVLDDGTLTWRYELERGAPTG